MATTRYVVAATPSSEEKVISNLKSARTEADARAKLDRVDVEVRTQATGKLAYTAQGAPVDTPAETAAAPQEEVEAKFAEMVAGDAGLAAMVNAPDDTDAPAEQGAASEGTAAAPAAEPDSTAPGEADAPDIAELFAELKAEIKAEHGAADKDADREAPCGCPVAKILATGEHGKGCADAPKVQQAAASVKKDAQPRRATARRTNATGRRSVIGDSAVTGWELLYDKPRQKAQVGRKEGKYALICTTHKHAHELDRLVQERALRQGKRSAWCTECTD
ncbi:hypothetical protein [Streptomyces sp. NPDC059278]|uniref:hypothetical protein n=1 Tax=Streptomyces sp. NPDC059278 TaxID=3346801 RepID=UPI0036A8C4AB